MARPRPPGAASPLSLSLLSSSLFSSVQGPRGPGGSVCAQDRPCHIGQSRGPDSGPPAPLWVRVGPLSGSRLCWPIQLFLAEAVENAFIFGRCRYKWAF